MRDYILSFITLTLFMAIYTSFVIVNKRAARASEPNFHNPVQAASLTPQ